MAIYMWREWEWTPPSDVVAYFPLDSKYQLNSQDGQKTLTTMGDIAYSFSDNCINLTDGWLSYNTSLNSATYTVFGWIGEKGGFQFSTDSWNGTGYREFSRTSYTDVELVAKVGNSYYNPRWTITTGWHSFVMACTGGNTKIYVDGVLLSNLSYGPYDVQSYMSIYKSGGSGILGKVGVSNIQRTATEALDFHNGTKADYGY